MARTKRRIPQGAGWAIVALVFLIVLIASGLGQAIVVGLIAVGLYAGMQLASRRSRSRSDR